MKNKKGQALIGIGIFAVLVVFLVGGGLVAWKTGLFSGDAPTQDDVDLDSTDCSNAPNITVNAVNELKQGTTVSVTTTNYRVDGEYIGTTAPSSFQKGSDVALLLSASNFIDKEVEEFSVACGNNIVAEKMFATSTNTFRIFNSNGDSLTDQATDFNTTLNAATLQPTSASPISLDVKIDSTTDESTGDLIIVVEAENTTEVDTIRFSGSGVTDADIPQFYAPVAAGSITDAFRVPALTDGESKTYTLTLSPETGITIGAGETSIYVTAYSEQAFVDVNGAYVVGVEDSDGTAKYEDTWDFDFCVATDNSPIITCAA